jgi:hypothetical protein
MAGHCFNERMDLIIEAVEVNGVLLVVNEDTEV